MAECLLVHPIKRLYRDMLVKERPPNRGNVSVRTAESRWWQNKASDLRSVHLAEAGQPLQSLSKASRCIRSLAWLSRELKAEPQCEMAAWAAGGRGSLQRRQTETMPWQAGTVPGKPRSAGDESLKGLPREVTLPSFQHPWAPTRRAVAGPCPPSVGRHGQPTTGWGELQNGGAGTAGARRPPGGAATPTPPPARRPGLLPAAGCVGGRCAALYGRCPWQGLCLLPAGRRRRCAWGAGAAARRQLPWPSPPRRTSCRCPVSAAAPSQGTELRVGSGDLVRLWRSPPASPQRRRLWAPSPAPQGPPPCPGVRPRPPSPGEPALSFAAAPGSSPACRCGPPARAGVFRRLGRKTYADVRD